MVHLYWLRLRIYNDANNNVVIKTMWWQNGTTMPTIWNLETTDSSASKITTGGNVGLASWKENTLYFDEFQVYQYNP
jgi:hypothetical protein